MKKKPKKPRNYNATDITRIQLHALKKDITWLRRSVLFQGRRLVEVSASVSQLQEQMAQYMTKGRFR